ncbi:MAG: hypothetical protein BA864_04170 [Desulfuromonadales bacterium C00003093]|nr:MAG: hypothetical protein BA864_04170 [Desulfuromonadales bacterium C00003093]
MIYNEQLEQNILGAIFCLNGFGETVSDVLDEVKVEDFYSQSHKAIYSAMLDCNSKGISPDVNTIGGHRLCEDQFMYIMEMWKGTSSGINLRKHSESLRKISELRRTQDRVNSINEIISSNGDLDEKLNEIEQIFSADIGFSSNEIGAKHISECASNYLDYLDKRWNNPDDVIFTTGIPELDAIFGGGLEVGLHAVAARPKMGKTELMGKMINHFAVDRNLPVYVGSLEMPDDQVMHRLTSSLSQVGKDEIKNNFTSAEGHYDAVAFSVFKKGLSDLANTNTYIDTRHTNTVKKIRRECVKIQKKHGRVGGIFVDYLGLLESDGKHDRHDLAIAHMTRSLKGMSKEFECPVVMLLQLNRGLESRDDKRPIPKDSRDSGSIEQDVDSWTAIYRDSVYKPESPWKMITEIIVRLNRHGETGTCYQVLTSKGFVNADEHTVAKLIHDEEVARQNKEDSSGDGYVGRSYSSK